MKRQTCECRDCDDLGTWWLRIRLSGQPAPETRIVCHTHLQTIERLGREGHIAIVTQPRATTLRKKAPRRRLHRVA